MLTRVSQDRLNKLGEERIDHRYKGFSSAVFGLTVREVCQRKLSLFGGAFQPPVMVLRESALTTNIDAMARFCADHGVFLAPHGKTTMAPALFKRQIDAGAWAITVATPSQVSVCRAFDFSPIWLANQLVDPAAIAVISADLDTDPSFDFLCYVDSVDGVHLLERELAARQAPRPIRVLVEVGYPQGRAGCRTIGDVMTVARTVSGSPFLDLAGVAGYEGAVGHDRLPSALESVRDYLTLIRRAAEDITAEGLRRDDAGRMIISAGGSVYFDEVVTALGPPWPLAATVDVVIRPGAYVSHDAGLYADVSPFTQAAADPRYQFEAAIELWGHVLSRPEPELVLASVGRRDAPFDQGLPQPERLRHPETDFVDVAGWGTFELNDQHAFVSVPADAHVAVGDWLRFGISHPCTAFDKWKLIPVVDDNYMVVDAIATFF